MSKASSLPYSGAHETSFTRVGSILTHKHYARQERDQRSSLLPILVNYDCKKFHKIDNTAECYKTFSVRNLLIFLAKVFVPGKPCQPSLMLVSEASSPSYSEAPETCFTLVGSVLTPKLSIGWRSQPGTSTLTYYQY